MFNKIIKRGHRKGSKSVSNEMLVTVNHSSVGNVLETQPGMPSPKPVLPSVVSNAAIESLPHFRDVSSSERPNLFIRKTQLCCVLCDFTDSLKMTREKEIKKKTLLELVNYLQSDSSKINEQMQEHLMTMISINIFRCLPPASHENTGSLVDGNDPDEDDSWLEPAWPHLQIVYELLLRYIVSSGAATKIAKRYIDHTFVFRLLDLFDSEDPREREFLKMVLHRIYGKFMAHRPLIRCGINNVFYRFIFETERHSGIGELLEIFGSIINGFALPMNEEHKLFLVRALLPLHKPKSVSSYHQQLTYCVTQFVEKDYKLADTVIKGLLKYWPVINCQKEVLFLGELEEVLDITQVAEFRQCMVPLFRQIGRCLASYHFQVAERALFLWNNEHMVDLIAQNRNVIFPIIFEPLEKNLRTHWNQAVHGLTVNVRRMFQEMDAELFEKCQREYEEKEAMAEELEEQRELIWKKLEAVASGTGVMVN